MPSSITREQISTAFWNLVQATPGITASSRRFVFWDDVNGADQFPFMTMIHFGEERIRQQDGTPVIKLFFRVLLYTQTGDSQVIPDTAMNTLLQALDQQVTPQAGIDVMENRLTLGGLVYYCQPRGRVFVDTSDVNGKNVAMVPFELLSSWFV